MYWFASLSTWTSSSSSRSPAATTIFLVITAPVGTAIATCLVRVPRRLCARFTASAACSRLLMLPSTTVSRMSGSMAYCSTRYAPLPASTISSIFTDDELMSSPNKGGAFGLNRSKSMRYFLYVSALRRDT